MAQQETDYETIYKETCSVKFKSYSECKRESSYFTVTLGQISRKKSWQF